MQSVMFESTTETHAGMDIAVQSLDGAGAYTKIDEERD
jgi:hypothetical protein